MNVTFDYALGDIVLLKEIGITGIVESLVLAQQGKQYRVAFWYNGKRESELVYGSEIEAKAKR